MSHLAVSLSMINRCIQQCNKVIAKVPNWFATTIHMVSNHVTKIFRFASFQGQSSISSCGELKNCSASYLCRIVSWAKIFRPVYSLLHTILSKLKWTDIYACRYALCSVTLRKNWCDRDDPRWITYRLKITIICGFCYVYHHV